MNFLIPYLLAVACAGIDELVESPPNLEDVKLSSIVGQSADAELPALRSPVDFITVDNQGKLLAHRKGYDIWIWNIEKRTLLSKLAWARGGELWVNCEFASSGKDILVCRSNGIVLSIDIQTQKVTQEWNAVSLTKQPQFPLTIMVSPNGSQIGVAGETCALFDQETRKTTLIPVSNSEKAFTRGGKYLPNGKEFIISGHDGFQIFATSPVRLIKKLECSDFSAPQSSNLLTWNSNSRYFATGNRGRVTLWDKESGNAITSASVFKGHVQGLAFLRGGKKLLIAGTDGDFDSRIYIVDTVSGKVERACEMNNRAPLCMAVSPDEKYAYFGTADGVKIYEIDRIADAKPTEIRESTK